MFHCHVNHHIHGGMSALYEVLPRPIDSLTRDNSGKRGHTKAMAGLFFVLLIAAAAVYGAFVVWRRRGARAKGDRVDKNLA
jgi:hypothetical protein